jgi:uncharacterized membrane protein
VTGVDLIDRLIHVATWLSPACLLSGLALWLIQPAGAIAASLLRAGLFSLMAIPTLRVFGSLAGALRARDWFFLAVTLAVVAELALAFTTAFAKR